jgi:hypothetical protein
MSKRRGLKLETAGPKLWLQRQTPIRRDRNSFPRGPAVTPEEQVQREDRPVAPRPGPGWAREARLRNLYAAEYPGITPGIWMPVAELSAKLIERVRAARQEGRHTRTFDPTHFEFRGGSTNPRPRASRTRSTDPEL